MYDREITPTELNALIRQKQDIILLDVRTIEETLIARLNAVHIPLNELPNRINELNNDDHIVVYCHHGVRSLTALAILNKYGFKRIQHLKGGIDAWSDTIDPNIRKY